MALVSSVDNDRNSIEKRSDSHEDEKREKVESGENSVFEEGQGDEALKLVGTVQTSQFTDAEYAKLRRKLVCCTCIATNKYNLTIDARILSFQQSALQYTFRSSCE